MLGRTDKPETVVVVAVRRVVAVPVRNRTVNGRIVIAATTKNAVGRRRTAATPFFFGNYRNIFSVGNAVVSPGTATAGAL